MSIADALPIIEPTEWDFAFFERVKVSGSNRVGIVMARTEHADDRQEFSVKFVDGTGYVTRGWFNSLDLEPAEVAANG